MNEDDDERVALSTYIISNFEPEKIIQYKFDKSLEILISIIFLTCKCSKKQPTLPFNKM